jgi:hypothetical protein
LYLDSESGDAKVHHYSVCIRYGCDL